MLASPGALLRISLETAANLTEGWYFSDPCDGSITVIIMMPLPVAASHLGFGDSGSCSDSESPGVSQSGEGPRICLAWAHCAMGAGQSGSTASELDSDARRDLRLPFKFKLARARCAGGSSPGCPGLGPGARRRWQAARGCPAAT